MPELPNNETRTRILDVAEDLFTRRGYAAVKLRDIAEALNMKHASLYYYAPDGKKQLFMEVMERSFIRHRKGLEAAVAEAGEDLRAQVHAVARWFVAHPPMNMARMVDADIEVLSDEEQAHLMMLGYSALRDPITAFLEAAVERGEIVLSDVDLGAMALVSLVQGVHSIPGQWPEAMRQRVGQYVADMLLDGLRKR
ncbi:MAG: TetR/AcrR family transcriptional regulator [bacterium]|nr:TetR/AcrR family transcriptional regulator [bacterium]